MYEDNRCVKPNKFGWYVNTNNEVKQCSDAIECQIVEDEMINFKCDEGFYQFRTSGECIEQDGKCDHIIGGYCLNCSNSYWMENGECKEIEADYCEHQLSSDICLKCGSQKVLSMGKCIDLDELECEDYDNDYRYCKQCLTDRYKAQEGCVPREGSIYENCQHPSTSNEQCIECVKGFDNINYQCYEHVEEKSNDQSEEDDDESQSQSSESEEQPVLKGEETTQVKIPVDNCKERSTKGCVRCEDGNYLENYECLKCSRLCKKCFNETYCTGCDSYSFLEDGECKTMNELIPICEQMMPNKQGCVYCIDGYYKAADGMNCEKCHESCKNCFNAETCTTCYEKHFLISDSPYQLCRHFDNLTNCFNKTSHGCEECDKG